MIKTLVLSTLLLVSLQAEAKMCKWLDEEGNWNFSFVNDKPTKTISGTVSTMALCPEPPPVKVTKIIYEEYIELNPINASVAHSLPVTRRSADCRLAIYQKFLSVVMCLYQHRTKSTHKVESFATYTVPHIQA
jgi:hypothetical protein